MSENRNVKLTSIGTLQKGSYIVIDNEACKISDLQISRPGKHGHAKVRLAAVGLIDGKKRIILKPGHDQVEVPIILKKTAQILAIKGNTASIMDNETYETFDLEIPKELKDKCVEGSTVSYWEILGNKVMKQIQ